MTNPDMIQHSQVDTLDERIGIAVQELELAIQWDRPAALLVACNSEPIRVDAETALENYLAEQGQEIVHIQMDEMSGLNLINYLQDFPSAANHIFFISGINAEQGKILSILGRHQDILINKNIRAVFWLTQKTLFELAGCAPDFWGYRQRVIDLLDFPNPDHILQTVIDSEWQDTGEYTGQYEDTEKIIDLHEAFLTELPENSESIPTRANLLLTLGILNWRKGNFEKANDLLQDAIKIAVSLENNWFEAECFNAIALVKFSQGKHDEAIDSYKQAIAIAPEQISVWNNLGNLCMKIMRNDEAMLAFQKALQHNPKDPVAWNGLGTVYYQIGYLDDSITAYRKAIEYAPAFADSWTGLGDACASIGRDKDAINAYQKAIKLDKHLATPWLHLAEIYCKGGRNKDAIKTYQRALLVDPNNHQMWNALGLVFMKVNSFEEAGRAFLKAGELDPGYGWAYCNLALAYANQDKYQEAIEACRKSVDVFTENNDKVIALDRLANFYRAINDYDNAIQAFQMADNLKGHVNTNRETTASDSAKSDQDQSSESTMEVSTFTEPEAKSQPEETASLEVIKQEKQDMPARKQQMEEPPMTTKKIPHTAHEFAPVTSLSEDQLAVDSIENEDELTEIKNPEVWNEKGNIHFQQGDYDKAIAAYNKAIELDLSFGWPYSNLALTYLTLGKFAEAILLYQKSAELLQKQEEQAASWNSIGNIYRHLNDYQGALNAYQKADDLDPQNAGKREKVDPAVSGPNSSNAQVWIELGNLFFKSASYSEAVNAYTNAVKLDPSSGWAQSNLAMSLVYQGNYKEAIPVYLKSIELFTDDKDKAASWNRLGNVYRKLNDESSAMKAYQTAVILSDEKTDLLTRTRFSLLSNCYTS